MPPTKYFKNQRFGCLVLKERIRQDKHFYWICLCDCGTETIKRTEHIVTSSHSLASCGCKHSELLSQTIRKDPGESARRSLFNQYKGSAKKRKMVFELSFEKFCELTQQDCTYCGVSPNYVHKGHRDCGDYKYNGIDRVDNKIGYTLSNSVTACRLCNQGKHDRSLDEFKEWLQRIAKKYKDA